MFVSPCGGGCQIHAASGGRHIATPGQAGLALPRHMVMGSPNGLKEPENMAPVGHGLHTTESIFDMPVNQVSWSNSKNFLA